MKNKKAVCIYRDPDYESKIKRELESARQIMQGLLDIWIRLDIGECPDINELVMRPENCYKQTIDKLVDIPDTGQRFKTKKESIIDTLELPDPSQLYASAKAVSKQPFCAKPELWSTNDDQVVLIEVEAKMLIQEKSVYATDTRSIQLAKDLNKWVDLTNKLNKELSGEILDFTPWTYNFFRNKLILDQDGYGGMYKVKIDPQKLREWLQ